MRSRRVFARQLLRDCFCAPNAAPEGISRNDGFVMMPNEVKAYHEGASAFEYKDTNGFMIEAPGSTESERKRVPDGVLWPMSLRLIEMGTTEGQFLNDGIHPPALLA